MNNEQKKLNRSNLSSNGGDLSPEIQTPEGGSSKFDQRQRDRYEEEQAQVISAKRVRRTMHKAGSYSLNKVFL